MAGAGPLFRAETDMAMPSTATVGFGVGKTIGAGAPRGSAARQGAMRTSKEVQMMRQLLEEIARAWEPKHHRCFISRDS
jgi:hypothetical protein